MNTLLRKLGFATVLILGCAQAVQAKVPAAEAARLKDGTLMPLGGEKKANADGSIPAWDGGLKTAPAGWTNGKYLVDPFPEDKPLFTITRDNLAQYKAKLGAGQVAMFERYPKTYRMPVYPTRRTMINAPHLYDAAYNNALNATLSDDGDNLQNAVGAAPFPIPKTGQEVIWNHKLKNSGVSVVRPNAKIPVNQDGSFTPGMVLESVFNPIALPGMTYESLGNVAFYYMALYKKPTRNAGTINLAHSTLNQRKEPQKVWEYNPGQRRLRRAPALAYDYPDPGSDGLTTIDQIDTFNGALDRYTWKLVGKQEMYIPYNAYRIHSDKLKYKDIVRPGHINQEQARYELHRVWVVEANLKSGTSHAYAKRRFYLDEDGWQIVAAENYDARGQLWRVQEDHSLVFYSKDDPRQMPVLDVSYDLLSGRYLLQQINNEDGEIKDSKFPKGHFEPDNMQNLAKGG
ncbi:DUF1329 domain-containing protein [Solimonas sp. K1W22B-7]|uniref:DUF1329 domain-containing protein n=1 Tax=Solimonas sp. K1W22B-7 TaxID=2303331 RepID=UPI000E32D7CF|nr:DUF1329 domain-containing protein [Solimonas sp. K1W22B-7]AXQ29804.1 DUF1329 domain-containing protein [Solimonas sp. K1W22B-7]